MWFDESGFKHNGPSPYQQRKLKELRSKMTIEEKYQEKVEEACRWLNNRLVRDVDTRNVKFVAFDYDSVGDIIKDFRKMMQLT